MTFRSPRSVYNESDMTSVTEMPSELSELPSLVAAIPEFADIISELQTGNSAAVNGAWGSACALTAATLHHQQPDKNLLVVLPSIRDLDEFAEQLAEFLPSHCLLYTSPSPRDQRGSRMPSSA